MALHLTIITHEGLCIRKRRYGLIARFIYFADFVQTFPDSNEVSISISSYQWELVDRFVKYLQTPINFQDWLALVTGAEWLNLIPIYSQVLLSTANKFLQEKGIQHTKLQQNLSGVLRVFQIILEGGRCQMKSSGKCCFREKRLMVSCCNPARVGSIYCEVCNYLEAYKSLEKTGDSSSSDVEDIDRFWI